MLHVHSRAREDGQLRTSMSCGWGRPEQPAGCRPEESGGNSVMGRARHRGCACLAWLCLQVAEHLLSVGGVSVSVLRSAVHAWSLTILGHAGCAAMHAFLDAGLSLHHVASAPFRTQHLLLDTCCRSSRPNRRDMLMGALSLFLWVSPLPGFGPRRLCRLNLKGDRDEVTTF